MLTKIAKVSTIVLLSISTVSVALNQPSRASDTTFFCAKNKGVYKTYVRYQDGLKTPIISWVTSLSPKLTPYERCKVVSERFQRSSDNGTLKTITNGMVNGYPVICATANSFDTCTADNVLFTLSRGQDSKDVLEKLMYRNALASATIINESSDKSRVYLDFDTYIHNVQPER